MSLPQHLGVLARTVGQMLSLPTKALLVVATWVLGVAALLVLLLIVTDSAGTVGTVLAIAAVAALAIPVMMLARRRRRFLRATEEAATDHQVILPGPSDSTEITPVDLTARIEEEMHGRPGEEDVQILFESITESRAPRPSHGSGARVTRIFSIGRFSPIGRALGSIERAQRALLTAAGGTAGAPYLKDDLRLTVASLLGTMVAIPLGALVAIIVAILLLV